MRESNIEATGRHRRVCDPGRAEAPPPARKRRRWLRWLVAGLSLVLLALLTVALALATTTGQRVLLGFLSGLLEERAGVGLEAEALRLDRSGRVDVDGLRLATPGHRDRPIVSADRVRVELRWSSLLGDRLELPLVSARGVRLDLAAPRPPAWGAGAPEPSAREQGVSESGPGGDGLAGFAVGRFEVAEVVVEGGVAGDGATWLRDWSIRSGEVSGSLRDGRLRAEADATVEVVARFPEAADEERWSGALRVSAWLSGDGRFELSRLGLVGDGVDLSLSGRGALGEQAALAALVSARVEPARWWPVADPLGGVAVDATVDLADRRLGATLRLDVDAVPGALFDPLLAESPLAGLRTEGTSVTATADGELEVDLSADGPRVDLLRGAVIGGWRRDASELLSVEVRAVDATRLAVDAASELELSVRLGGDRGEGARARGRLVTPAWDRWRDARLEDVELILDVEDVPAFVAELWRPPPEAARWLPAGSVNASAAVSGPLVAPAADLDASWSVDDTAVLTVVGRGTIDGPMEVEAALLPESPGRRDLRATVDLTTPRPAVRARLGLALPDVGATVEEAAAVWAEAMPGSPVTLDQLADPALAATLRGAVEAEISARGPITSPTVTAEVDWHPADGQRARLVAVGGALDRSPWVRNGSRAELVVTALDLAELLGPWVDFEVPGRLTGRVEAGLDEIGRSSGAISARVEAAAGRQGSWLESGEIEASLGDGVLSIERLVGRLSAGESPLAGATLEVGGELALDRAEAGLELRLHAPAARASTAVGRLSLDRGRAVLAVSVIDLPGTAEVEVPLGSLLAMTGTNLPLGQGDLPRGLVRVRVAELDLEPWGEWLLPESEALRLHGMLAADLAVDLQRPAAAEGWVEIVRFGAAGEESASVVAARPLRVTLADGRFELGETRLKSRRGLTLAVAASGSLDRDWALEAPPNDLVETFAVDVDGAVATAVLRPFIGGIPAGELGMTISGRYEGGALELDAVVDGTDASLTYPAAYVTKIERPRFSARMRDGVLEIQDATLLLNRGEVELSGRVGPAGSEATASFDGVRYRVDHGLGLILDGVLRFSKRRGGLPGTLAGRVVVQRGALRRDLFLERELLDAFSSRDVPPAEPSALDPVVLDLSIVTAQGISVDNNLAELELDWSVIEVSGTIGEPLVSGRIEGAPGGWLEVLGQLYRVDELSVELFEDPTVETEIEIETTSLLDDPTLYQQRASGTWYAGMNVNAPQNDLFWKERQHGSEAALAQFSSTLASYFGDRVARAIGAGGLLQFSVQPLPLYGETSTEGRFTVSQRLGRFATFISSSDTRNSEARTYILESTELMPRTKVQMFNNDEKNEGITAQRTQPLFADDDGRDPEPRLGGVEWHVPENVPRRRLRRAAELKRGDPFPIGADFDVEIGVLEAMRTLGFPGAGVEVVAAGYPHGPIDLSIAVSPGPEVEVAFEGLEIPRGYRDLVTAQFLPREIDRGASLDIVAEEAERTLRRLGHLRPRAVVTVEPVAGFPFREHRRLRIVSSAERRVTIDRLRIEGLSPEDRESVAERFSSLLTRIELAEGSEDADTLLRRSVHAAGYERAVVVGRELSSDGTELVVTIDAGAQQVVGAVDVVGLDDEQVAVFRSLGDPVGDPARRPVLIGLGQRMLGALRADGYPTATVHVDIDPSPDSPGAIHVTYEFTTGARYEIWGVEYEGLVETRPEWLDEIVGVEPGEPLHTEAVARARRSLYRTTLFETVNTGLRFGDDGAVLRGSAMQRALEVGDGGPVTTVFELDEGPRYLLGYGGRWEEGRGFSAIADLVNRNVFGRGQSFGLRGVLGEEEERLRLYYGLPRTPTPRSHLELFLEWSEEQTLLPRCGFPSDSGGQGCERPAGEAARGRFDLEELELRAQVTFPFARHSQVRLFATAAQRRAESDGEPVAESDRVISPAFGVQVAHDTRRESLTGGLGEGRFVGLQVTGGLEALGSDVTALEAIVEGKFYRRLGKRRWGSLLWAQRYRASAQQAWGDQPFPVFDQFLIGGEYTLRGYATETVGPGQAQLLMNQELHFPIWSVVSGVAFFDAGNVWETLGRIDDEVLTATGIGLRAATFRLDLGVPLNPRPIDGDYEIYFGFGHSF